MQDNEELDIEKVVFDNNNMRPLHLAVSKARFSMVLFLLSKGVSPSAQDAAGRNALQYALFCGNVEMHQLLAYHVKNGKESFIRDSRGNTRDNLSLLVTSPENDNESLGFSNSNSSHYMSQLMLTPQQGD
jgi:ankyrin repeat protein